MPLDALALALGAAVLHALWNLLLARERDTEAATAVALISLVGVLILPAALTWRVEAAAIPYVIGSAALELAYVGLLAAAYRRFDLSVVYPVARGLAPVGERACDLWALARSALVIDVPPCYLRLPHALRTRHTLDPAHRCVAAGV